MRNHTENLRNARLARACTVFGCADKTIEEMAWFRSGLTRLRPGANFKLKKRRVESTQLRLLLQDVKEMIATGFPFCG